MKKYISEEKLMLGAMYAPFCRTKAVDMSEWERDMINCRELGYTCVHGFAEWHDIEYKKGEFDFTQVDHFVDCASKHGLVVIVNIATQNNVGFYSPRWLMEEYKGRGFVDCKGISCEDGQFVVPCIDDPVYQKYACRYLEQVAKHFANDKRIGGYVLWGEPILFRPGTLDAICYCEHTIKKFKIWLENKYKTIYKLNETWGTEGPSDFDSFDKVKPPTGYTRQLGGYIAWEDFRKFMEENMSENIANADRIFKENGALQPTIVEMLADISSHCIDPWKVGKTTDIVGSSDFNRPGRNCSFNLALIDSIAKNYDKSMFTVEALGGPIYFERSGYCQTPSVNELKSTMLQRLGNGTGGFMYWCYRPRLSDLEGSAYGLVKPNGQLLPRAIETGKLSKQLNEHKELYMNTERNADVVILTSEYINHIMEADGMHDRYYKGVRGAYAILLDLHINADIINIECVLKGNLSNYKVLIMPSSYILDEATASAIEKFVKNGGVVIADYTLAQKTHGGLCYLSTPGAGLEKVFGFERDDVYCVGHESLVHENRIGIKLHSLIDVITPTTSHVIETYDSMPVVTKNIYGKGTTYYFADELFMGYSNAPQKNIREIIGDVVKKYGVKAYLSLENGDAVPQTSIVTAMLNNVETDAPSVYTLTNASYDVCKDTVVLPKNTNGYCVIGDDECSVEQKADCSLLKVTLKPWQSIAVYPCK